VSSILIINPRHEALVLRHRLDRFEHVMGQHEGHNALGHAWRDYRQIEIDDSGRPVRLFVKREWQTQFKDRFANWTAGIGWGTKARREWYVLRAMHEAGIGCPEPLVLAESGGMRPQGYLILLAIPGVLPLSHFLFKYRSRMSVHECRQLAAHLGHEVARLHEAGITHPDLYSKHIFLSDRAEEGQTTGIQRLVSRRVYFIDVQRSTIGRFASVSRRVIDLAALDSTLPQELAGETDRYAFLLSYLSHCRLALEPGPFVAAIRRRVRKLSGRSKICEMQRLLTPG
jgi:tRNA A-37 threonylcarbamoyl transferase component Bud32